MKLDSNVHLDSKWGIVMEEAWPSFRESPPKHLYIQVEDGPGDAEARECSFQSDRRCCARWDHESSIGDMRSIDADW